MKNRDTWHMEENGEPVTCVPLNKGGVNGSAFVDPADYDALIAKGVSGNWFKMSGGQVGVAVRSKTQLVARLLLDLGPREVVEYRDGNRLNLRRDNLWVRDSTGSWKPRVVVQPQLDPLPSDMRIWVNFIGAEIAGQNAFDKRSTDFVNKARANWRK